jgi:hypothetical protein
MRSPVSCLAISANTSALRNFSLPRERCLDTSPVIIARPLPIPPPCLAIGITSPVRPLPAISHKAKDDQSSLLGGKMVGEFVIQPLRIRKISSCSIKLGQQPLLDVSSPEQFSVHSTADAMSSVGPSSILRVRDSWPMTTNCSTPGASQEDVTKATGTSGKLTSMPVLDEAPARPTMAYHMESLITPSINIQQPTPTPSIAPDSPKALIIATSRTSTLRVVSCHLEVPEKIHHGSLRRKQ